MRKKPILKNQQLLKAKKSVTYGDIAAKSVFQLGGIGRPPKGWDWYRTAKFSFITAAKLVEHFGYPRSTEIKKHEVGLFLGWHASLESAIEHWKTIRAQAIDWPQSKSCFGKFPRVSRYSIDVALLFSLEVYSHSLCSRFGLLGRATINDKSAEYLTPWCANFAKYLKQSEIKLRNWPRVEFMRDSQLFELQIEDDFQKMVNSSADGDEDWILFKAKDSILNRSTLNRKAKIPTSGICQADRGWFKCQRSLVAKVLKTNFLKTNSKSSG